MVRVTSVKVSSNGAPVSSPIASAISLKVVCPSQRFQIAKALAVADSIVVRVIRVKPKDKDKVIEHRDTSKRDFAYQHIAKADATDAVLEIVETNNTASRSIQIGPDLSVTSLSALLRRD